MGQRELWPGDNGGHCSELEGEAPLCSCCRTHTNLPDAEHIQTQNNMDLGWRSGGISRAFVIIQSTSG